MIAFVLAAVIAQPLDAVYSTVGNPKARGADLLMRFPASWRASPSADKTGVVDFASPDGSTVVRLCIDKDVEWVVDPGVSHPYTYYKTVLDNYPYERLHPPVDGVITGTIPRVGQFMMPAKTLEYASHSNPVARELLYVFFHNGLTICVRCARIAPEGGGAENDRQFNALRPLFSAMVQSMADDHERAKLQSTNWPLLGGLAGLTAAMTGGFFWYRRRHATHLPERSKRSRTRRSGA